MPNSLQSYMHIFDTSDVCLCCMPAPASMYMLASAHVHLEKRQPFSHKKVPVLLKKVQCGTYQSSAQYQYIASVISCYSSKYIYVYVHIRTKYGSTYK